MWERGRERKEVPEPPRAPWTPPPPQNPPPSLVRDESQAAITGCWWCLADAVWCGAIGALLLWHGRLGAPTWGVARQGGQPCSPSLAFRVHPNAKQLPADDEQDPPKTEAVSHWGYTSAGLARAK